MSHIARLIEARTVPREFASDNVTNAPALPGPSVRLSIGSTATLRPARDRT